MQIVKAVSRFRDSQFDLFKAGKTLNVEVVFVNPVYFKVGVASNDATTTVLAILLGIACAEGTPLAGGEYGGEVAKWERGFIPGECSGLAASPVTHPASLRRLPPTYLAPSPQPTPPRLCAPPPPVTLRPPTTPKIVLHSLRPLRYESSSAASLAPFASDLPSPLPSPPLPSIASAASAMHALYLRRLPSRLLPCVLPPPPVIAPSASVASLRVLRHARRLRCLPSRRLPSSSSSSVLSLLHR
ncbi:hypothetical protein Fmac_002944 [Flemingia macrophylla]|uniref:Uncharacterized protein n=1 Tax=Flemingia macrophylla TaxID=520843 RepID=A0ABD1NLD4_9FABA